MAKQQQRRINREIREKLISAANGRCSICGLETPFLELDAIVPLSAGRTLDETNLRVVCAECHRQMDMVPSEIQFLQFLCDLLEASPQFIDVRREPSIRSGNLRPDITATEILPNGRKRKILIETKSSSVLTANQTANLIHQLRMYSDELPDYEPILAFPGKAPLEITKELQNQRVEFWDLDEIGSLFQEQIQEARSGYYSLLFRRALRRKRPETELIDDLKTCPTGIPGWSRYQKLIGRILEVLFCPPLDQPFSESTDHTKANRRDFVFPNYASEGFWYALRQRYGADYITVDAKNGKNGVTKSNVLQVANYLKPHGVGLFGLIVGRKGPDKAALVTLREQWLMHSKLIVVLHDKDIENMLLQQLAQGDPARVVSNKIQKFRLEF